jgi:hypothetical protein
MSGQHHLGVPRIIRVLGVTVQAAGTGQRCGYDQTDADGSHAEAMRAVTDRELSRSTGRL